MTPQIRLERALPRLLVSLAVLFCLLGLGESMSGGPADSRGATAASQIQAMQGGADEGAIDAAELAVRSAGHGGAEHGGHGMHGAGCATVVSAAVPLLVSIASVDLGPGSWFPAPFGGSSQRGAAVAAPRGPPGLSTLCVQRV
ncbi:MAG: hypothetical protein ACT4QG_12525 [Sporichthyaceae bacterium]